MKLWTAGRLLWTRTVGSTIVGQGIDSLIFYPLAFYGVWDDQTLLIVLVTQFALKVGWEALLPPVTYAVVGWLKRREGVDVYDGETEFTPFRAKGDRRGYFRMPSSSSAKRPASDRTPCRA